MSLVGEGRHTDGQGDMWRETDEGAGQGVRQRGPGGERECSVLEVGKGVGEGTGGCRHLPSGVLWATVMVLFVLRRHRDVTAGETQSHLQ